MSRVVVMGSDVWYNSIKIDNVTVGDLSFNQDTIVSEKGYLLQR